MPGPFGFARRIGVVFAMALVVTTGGIAAEMIMNEPDEQTLVSVDALSVPDAINAGDTVMIEATSASVGGVAEVLVHGAYATLRFEMVVANGEGQLMLPAAVTQHAGVVTIESGGQVKAIEILPGEVATLVAPLVGPRTVVANGADQTLAVLLPTDRFGNQVADGTDTNIIWEQPGNVDSTAAPQTTDGMAWALIPSGELAGQTMVRAIAESTTETRETVRAAAVRIDEVPGVVSGITLEAATTAALADGRSVVALHTGELTDRFGNILADGTLAQFIFDGPSGTGAVTGTVQNGAVHIELTAPTLPGTVIGHLNIHGVVSNDVVIDYSSAIAGFDVRLEFIGQDAVLRVDGALDPSGAFVADGTEVTWGDHRASLRRGSTEIWVPAPLVDANATVDILGLTQQTETSTQ